MPPETIADRYRVEREVGRGGMGSVWLCRDEVLGRDVAIKQVGHLPGESMPNLARALREARSSAALNHRNVVAVYDAFEEDDHVWLVMEYVPGRTLSEILAQEGPLAPERAAHLGAQVADGLAAAHARGTVHRDVKPGNILVGEGDVAKISDFGISRTRGDAQLTQSGLMTGTPAYFSPGLARGEEPTPADDVWALGATLYAAVEGRPPYPEQANPLAMLSTIASGRPRQPQRAGALTDVIGRMLDPDPASRWSMADAAHALHRRAAAGRTDRTREQTAAAPLKTPVVTPVVAPVADPDPTPATPVPAHEPPRRRRTALGAVAALLLLALVAGGGWLLVGRDGGSTQASGSTGAGGEGSPRQSPADPAPKRTHSPSQSPSSTAPTTPPSSPASSPPATQQAPAGSPAAFVSGYYGALPSDTRTAWSELTSGFQDQVGSYGDYRSFWDTIEAVSVDATRPHGADAVDTTLTYTKSDGSTDHEVRRIYLERSGDGWLIRDDAVVG